MFFSLLYKILGVKIERRTRAKKKTRTENNTCIGLCIVADFPCFFDCIYGHWFERVILNDHFACCSLLIFVLFFWSLLFSPTPNVATSILTRRDKQQQQQKTRIRLDELLSVFFSKYDCSCLIRHMFDIVLNGAAVFFCSGFCLRWGAQKMRVNNCAD